MVQRRETDSTTIREHSTASEGRSQQVPRGFGDQNEAQAELGQLVLGESINQQPVAQLQDTSCRSLGLWNRSNVPEGCEVLIHGNQLEELGRLGDAGEEWDVEVDDDTVLPWIVDAHHEWRITRKVNDDVTHAVDADIVERVIEPLTDLLENRMHQMIPHSLLERLRACSIHVRPLAWNRRRLTPLAGVSRSCARSVAVGCTRCTACSLALTFGTRPRRSHARASHRSGMTDRP